MPGKESALARLDVLRDGWSFLDFLNQAAGNSRKAETEPWPDTGELSVIEALFASRCMEDADMIVAGAYSHSRFRETLFGGVTRDLLRQFSLPVFVSH
ncbi:universal stress protein [Nordella sp. HKS 07]|uniref:universal stress protein n=1 Tax=Nordella sp. HKS 07 TaxID=2712222 RepID=UPI0013E1531C|nr:universal stress protein [Nordella sp. HKS 07]QIG51029.1 universal stress protein [Nordella sp. HKS 07]